jgi:hypothetical protein
VLPGHIYLAPGGRHLKVARRNGTAVIELDDGPAIHFCKPAVDPLFVSAAEVWGSWNLALILTGMGDIERAVRAMKEGAFEFIEKPYGFREAALRNYQDGTVYARIREVVLPYYSFIPGNHEEPRLVVVVVPIDDEWSAHWYYYMNPFGPVPDWYIKRALEGADVDDDDFAKDRGDITNTWNQDREAMKNGHFSGITKNFVYEDFIIEESMGPIMDRSKEFLGSSDAVIVRTRRMLLRALDNHAQGKMPFGLDENVDYRAIRALAIRYPKGEDWKTFDTKQPPTFEFQVSDAAE